MTKTSKKAVMCLREKKKKTTKNPWEWRSWNSNKSQGSIWEDSSVGNVFASEDLCSDLRTYMKPGGGGALSVA